MGWLVVKIAGTFILSLLVVLVLLSSLNLTNRRYKRMVEEGLARNQVSDMELVGEDDLKDLPLAVQNYLRYVGVVGREKIYQYSLDITGEFKMSEDHDFMPVTIKQTSFQDDFTRLFYMQMRMKGLKIAGLHHLVNGEAVMEIKMLDLFKIVDERGEAMNQAELVTVFNDMAIMAPASLIDERITWEEVNDYEVIGTITNGEYSVSARLYFNEEGKLINFMSLDRYAIIDGEAKLVRWETPITAYHEVNGLNLPYEGSAKWVYDDREFTYVRMTLHNVRYNEEME